MQKFNEFAPFIAGINNSGYLPESEPQEFEQFDDAVDYIKAEMLISLGIADENDDNTERGHYLNALDILKGADRMGPAFGIKVLGTVFFIQPKELNKRR